MTTYRPSRFLGPAWRAETGYRHSVADTAADVVNYEQNELGNPLGVPAETVAELHNRPAGDLVWVTRTRKAAGRYGYPEKYLLPAGSKAIAEDGDGGFLVLKGGSKGKQKLPKPSKLSKGAGRKHTSSNRGLIRSSRATTRLFP